MLLPSRLARVIRGVVEPVVDAVGTALRTIVHIPLNGFSWTNLKSPDVEIAYCGGRFFSPGSKASSNGSQYTCRRVDDGYGLLSLALPQWIFCTLIG
jgi:hypothetical protein